LCFPSSQVEWRAQRNSVEHDGIMALNIASRRGETILQNITKGIQRKKAAQRELHRDGAMCTTGSAACCRALVLLGWGQSVVPIQKNTAVTPQKSSKDHRKMRRGDTTHNMTNMCTAHTTSSEEDVLLTLIPLFPFHYYFISKLPCVPCSP